MYQPYEYTSPVVRRCQIENATGTNAVNLASVARDGERYDLILAASTDTSPRVLQVLVSDGVNWDTIGSVSIPAGSGLGGTPAVDVLGAIMPTGQTSLLLPTGQNLAFAVESAVTAAKVLTVALFGGVF